MSRLFKYGRAANLQEVFAELENPNAASNSVDLTEEPIVFKNKRQRRNISVGVRPGRTKETTPAAQEVVQGPSTSQTEDPVFCDEITVPMPVGVVCGLCGAKLSLTPGGLQKVQSYLASEQSLQYLSPASQPRLPSLAPAVAALKKSRDLVNELCGRRGKPGTGTLGMTTDLSSDGECVVIEARPSRQCRGGEMTVFVRTEGRSDPLKFSVGKDQTISTILSWVAAAGRNMDEREMEIRRWGELLSPSMTVEQCAIEDGDTLLVKTLENGQADRDVDFLRLKVRLDTSEEHKFRIHKSDSLLKLAEAVAQRENTSVDHVELYFDGVRVNGGTAQDYDLESLDLIDAKIVPRRK